MAPTPAGARHPAYPCGMNRVSRAQEEQRQAKRRWIALAIAGTLLLAGFGYGAFRFFEGRAVLLKAEFVEPALTESIVRIGRKQPADVDCPNKDLRKGDRVTCDVRFTDGSTGRLKFGVKGLPGQVTPIVEGA